MSVQVDKSVFQPEFYDERIPKVEASSFYDRHLKVNLSNPYVYNLDSYILDINKVVGDFFLMIQDEKHVYSQEFKQELRSKSIEQRKNLEMNLLDLISLFKMGNEISTLSWIALKIANFILPLFGYEPYKSYESECYKEFDDSDIKAFKNFSRKARELTTQERENASLKISFQNRYTGGYFFNQSFTDAFEQLRLGLRGKITCSPYNYFNIEEQNFLIRLDENKELILEYHPPMDELKQKVMLMSYDIDKRREALCNLAEKSQAVFLRPGNEYTFCYMATGAKMKIEASCSG